MSNIQESIDVRVARLEERADSLEKWIETLQTDIKETKLLIANMDHKLDGAIDLSQRSVPTWVHYMLWFLLLMLGIALGGQLML
ncbi:MAG: hypothetical protein C7B46_07130 [Sulfobacillus benefaciens]|uniref:Uncharacterized protein n=1 Tax=Sulfobacillus benefaciens TaxID=453960 RepID=A0A2T2XHR9_9FIRM|nr:MAG: hypothetical protein C7B46_07130 [Sulfobacillus benefaciens]